MGAGGPAVGVGGIGVVVVVGPSRTGVRVGVVVEGILIGRVEPQETSNIDSPVSMEIRIWSFANELPRLEIPRAEESLSEEIRTTLCFRYIILCLVLSTVQRAVSNR